MIDINKKWLEKHAKEFSDNYDNEDYNEDKYGPSWLIYGTTIQGRPLHVQCSYPSRPKIKIITIYQPDPKEWIAYRKRRSERNEV